MRVRRLAAWTALPLAVTLGLVACGSGGDGGSGESDPNAAVRIEIAEPQHLVPTNTNETSGSQVLSALFSPLVDYDEAHKPYEVAAESITSEDNTTWTIKLKDGYTFHNGEAVTADNYIDAWNYGAYAPNGQNSSFFFEKIAGYDDLQGENPSARTLSGLAKVDDLTFTVTLSQPYSEFKSMLGYTAFYPLPKAAFSAPGELDRGVRAGADRSGPVQDEGHLAARRQGRGRALRGLPRRAAEGGRRRVPHLPAADRRVRGRAVGQPRRDQDAFRPRTSPPLPSTWATGSSRAPRRRCTSSPSRPSRRSSATRTCARPSRWRSTGTRSPRRSSRTRSSRPARSSRRWSPATGRTPSAPRASSTRTEAKALYQAAGGPSKITLSYNGDGGHKDWIDATCNQLKANLGVDCVGNAEPKFADLLTKVKAKQPVGLFRLGWVMDYPSMENYLAPLFSSNGSSNYYGYRNAEFDRLLAEGISAPSEEEAIQKYQAAEDLLAEDLPVVPLRYGQNNFGHSTKVKNVEWTSSTGSTCSRSRP